MALAPKKSIALQAGRQPSVGVAPVSSGSGVSVTTSPTGQVSPMVMPVPSAGQAGVGAQGTPSKVAEQPTMVATPLPTTGQMGLPTTLVAPTMEGMM